MTSVDSDEPLRPPFKLRSSKWCSVKSLTVIEYYSDTQRLWSDWAYAQAGLSLCWSHIPHCWKSHVSAHIGLIIILVLAYIFPYLWNETYVLGVQKELIETGLLSTNIIFWLRIFFWILTNMYRPWSSYLPLSKPYQIISSTHNGTALHCCKMEDSFERNTKLMFCDCMKIFQYATCCCLTSKAKMHNAWCKKSTTTAK